MILKLKPLRFQSWLIWHHLWLLVVMRSTLLSPEKTVTCFFFRYTKKTDSLCICFVQTNKLWVEKIPFLIEHSQLCNLSFSHWTHDWMFLAFDFRITSSMWMDHFLWLVVWVDALWILCRKDSENYYVLYRGKYKMQLHRICIVKKILA